MKCSYCGAPVEKGRLFCMNCGEEIQWVPEYHAIGTYRSQTENSTADKKITYSSVKKPKEDTEVSSPKPKRKKSPFIIGIILMVLCVCILFGVKYYMDQKNYNSFEYQMNMAETDYSNRAYDTAYEYIDRAIMLDSESIDAVLLKAQILMGLSKQNEAIAVLLDLIEDYPDNVSAYTHLIRIYESQDSGQKIKELLAACQEESILERFSGYIASKPVFSFPSGDYEELLTVELYSPDGEDSEIYYTTDGSTPDQDSDRYVSGIDITEGTTQIKAVTVNKKGITSDLTEGTYHVTLLPPDPPKISPSSGEFTKAMDTKIYVIVPSGCTAYYAFDEEPTTASTVYSGPIEMLDGEHTFQAILIDSHGKQSDVGSASYILVEEE